MVFDTIGLTPHSWAGKTYAEIVEIAEQPGAILIVPVGSIEQHGHHLPVATDTILVDAMANLGADRVSDDLPVLVLPPVWSGFSPHHLSFGGTLTLDFQTLQTMLEELAHAALENGFDALLFLNGHGGNGPLISGTASTVGVDHPEHDVLGLTYFQLATSFINEIRESETGGMSHGGEFETSLMMYLQPELVREDKMTAPYLDEPYEHGVKDLVEGGSLAVYRPFTDYSETGAIGAPEWASSEKGERIYNKLGDELEALLIEIHEQNRS